WGAREMALELQGRTITERRMQTLAVVDFVQELANRSPCLFQAAIFGAIDFLVLESFNKTLRLRIVIGRSGAAHADADAVLLKFCGVVARSILHTAIGMMHQSRLRSAMPQRHPQGFQRQSRFQAPPQCPAEPTPRTRIQQDCQITKFQLKTNGSNVRGAELIDAGDD